MSIGHMRKVITTPAFKTQESSALLNHDTNRRSVIVGRRAKAEERGLGFIGKVVEQSGGSNILDYAVWSDFSYPHVIGVFGTRGTGKSFDLGVFAECIASADSVTTGGGPSAATVIFDVQDQFWTLGYAPDSDLSEDAEHISYLEHWNLPPTAITNVNLWVPAGASSTLPDAKNFRIAPEQLSTDDWLSLVELERYSPMGQALLTLLDSQDTLEPRALASACVPQGDLTAFQGGTIDGLRWRLQSLAEASLVSSPGIDIDELMVPGRTSVFLLRQLPESLRSLTVAVLLRIFNQRMSRAHQSRKAARRLHAATQANELPERLWVVLDEAHTVAPRDGRTAATGPIVDYVKRGRDAGLSLMFATQQPAAVDNRLMSQVDMTLTHALSFDSDLQAALGRMPTRTSVTYEQGGFPLPSLSDAIRSLEPGEAIVADAANGRVLTIRIRPRLSAHGGHTPPAHGSSEP